MLIPTATLECVDHICTRGITVFRSQAARESRFYASVNLCASKVCSLNLSLRHEVARLVVWHAVVTRPVVPSAVSYADVRESNDPYRAFGHGTHSHPTGTRTEIGRASCRERV